MTDTAHPSVIEPVPADCDGNVTIGQPVAGRRAAHITAMSELEAAAYRAVRAANKDTGASEELRRMASRAGEMLEALA